MIKPKIEELLNPAKTEEIFEGKDVINANGEKITGTFTIDTEMNTQTDLITQIATALEGKAAGGGVELPSLTQPATGNQILNGYDAIDDGGNRIVGTIPNAEADYYECPMDESTGTLYPLIAFNQGGYVLDGYNFSFSYQLDTKEGTTITPTSSEQIAVPAGTYCTGDIKVAAASGGGDNSGLARKILEEGVFSDETITAIPNDGLRGWVNLETIELPNVINIGTYACYNCTGLTAINFPKCTTIGNYAFYNNTSVTSINLPEVTTIGTNSFRQLTALTYIALPACTVIASTAFQKCTLLEKADFLVAKSMAANAFNQCSALTALILRNSTLCTMANISAVTATPIASGTGYVYVPSNLVDSYKSATNWSTYATQIRAIEDYPDICG